MIAPRIPRHRPPVIRCGGHWYENTAARLVALVVFAVFAGIATHTLIAWWALT